MPGAMKPITTTKQKHTLPVVLKRFWSRVSAHDWGLVACLCDVFMTYGEETTKEVCPSWIKKENHRLKKKGLLYLNPSYFRINYTLASWLWAKVFVFLVWYDSKGGDICLWLRRVCVYTVSYTLYANIQRVLFRLVSVWFLCTVPRWWNEKLMDVEESPLGMGEETGQRGRGQKQWRGEGGGWRGVGAEKKKEGQLSWPGRQRRRGEEEKVTGLNDITSCLSASHRFQKAHWATDPTCLQKYSHAHRHVWRILRRLKWREVWECVSFILSWLTFKINQASRWA